MRDLLALSLGRSTLFPIFVQHLKVAEGRGDEYGVLSKSSNINLIALTSVAQLVGHCPTG